MKIIHSFWSKPFFHLEYNKMFGGWRSKEYFFMSWALSCLTFSKFYKDFELVTDNYGYELIKKLKLPYTNVRIELDSLNSYPRHLWAIGKLYTYSIQQEPFLHVDNDIFIWERLDSKLDNANLIAQNIDLDKGHYSYALDFLKKYEYTLSDLITEDIKLNKSIESCNAGLLGGQNISFIQDFSKQAFKFVNSNLNKNIPLDYGTSYALIYEQYLFSCLARRTNTDITYYIESKESKRSDYFDITDFRNKYQNKKKYVHLLGSKKREMKTCYELRNQLETNFPEYLYRIEKNLYDQKL